MLKIDFSTFPDLQTERCRLRMIRADDAPQILRLRSDTAAMQYIDRDLMTETGEAHDLINRINDGIGKNENITWGIALAGNDRLIGTAGLWKIVPEHYRAEIGYMLLPEYWGRGLMYEILSTVIAYGFETMNLHSIEANINPSNQASIRLIEKCGFVREGYFRENYYYKGKFLDSAIYSLVRSKEQ